MPTLRPEAILLGSSPIGVLVFGPAVRASVLPLNYKQPCEEEWLSVRWSVLEQGPLLVDAKRNLARERRPCRREAGGPAGPRSGAAARERRYWRPIRGSKEMCLPPRLLAGYLQGWPGSRPLTAVSAPGSHIRG